MATATIIIRNNAIGRINDAAESRRPDAMTYFMDCLWTARTTQ
jgi:hypothetical protein